MHFIPLVTAVCSLLIQNAISFVIDEDKKSFVRFTDDGLYKVTLNAFEHEWHNTFISGLLCYNLYYRFSYSLLHLLGLDPKKTPRLMKSNSPVNIWFRCVDMQVRGYFFIESLRKQPTANFNGIKLYNSIM